MQQWAFCEPWDWITWASSSLMVLDINVGCPWLPGLWIVCLLPGKRGIFPKTRVKLRILTKMYKVPRFRADDICTKFTVIVLIIESMYREHGKNSAGRARPDSLVPRRSWEGGAEPPQDPAAFLPRDASLFPGSPEPGIFPPEAGLAAAPWADLRIHPRIILRGISFLPAAVVTLKIPPTTQNTHSHLLCHPFSWAQAKSKGVVFSSGGLYPGMMFFTKNSRFWVFIYLQRLQYLKGSINI